MAVVIHHNGIPTEITTIQKDRITKDRLRMFSGVSGGGVFITFESTEVTAFKEGCSTAAVDRALGTSEAALGPDVEVIITVWT